MKTKNTTLSEEFKRSIENRKKMQNMHPTPICMTAHFPVMVQTLP